MIKYSREEKYSKPKDIKELLVIAREREKASVDFYREMSRHSLPATLFTLINKLKDAEIAHVQWIERKMEELGL